MSKIHYTVAIIGGGAAGLTAALYLGRAKIDTIVIEKDFGGGQMLLSPLLENVPGYYGNGSGLVAKMLIEIDKYPSVEIRNYTAVTNIHQIDGSYLLNLDDGLQIHADYVICASGAAPISLPNSNPNHTHYCVTCDGTLYQDKLVAVVGGGNSALQYAIELSKYAAQVYMCTNMPFLIGEPEMQKKVLDNSKIQVVYNFTATSFDGRVLEQEKGSPLMVDGVFVAMGFKPSTDYCDISKTNGYFITNDKCEIADHLYAVGDCRKKDFNQIVIAMADGCRAALSIIKDLEK